MQCSRCLFVPCACCCANCGSSIGSPGRGQVCACGYCCACCLEGGSCSATCCLRRRLPRPRSISSLQRELAGILAGEQRQAA